MSNYSAYNSTKNLKITYFLGAGASYHSLPIWKAQGKSMVEVADYVMYFITATSQSNLVFNLSATDAHKEVISSFMQKLKRFGLLAQEYGSIDIYAKRLFLIGEVSELNELKYCLSVYFDLWENFLHNSYKLPGGDFGNYHKIDKRYLSLLSIILEQSQENPKLSENISFITWNYDLQLETAYGSFLRNKAASILEINKDLKFLDTEQNDSKRIFHLNGYRGLFYEEGKLFETVERDRCELIDDYLLRLADNFKQFKNADYTNCIKYAWESSSEVIQNAKQTMRETDILIVIGYSFPAFNRKIDQELIREFESAGSYNKVIYQDPFANQDIVNTIFLNPKSVKIQKENTSQFYIPHEFLSPSSGREIYI